MTALELIKALIGNGDTSLNIPVRMESTSGREYDINGVVLRDKELVLIP